MPKEFLDEREFELINIIGAKLGSNQRDLSRQLQMSLGMVNLLIRRLIAKGYIRIEQLDKRKVQYLLTPKGFTEKLKKSVKYTLNTINSIGLIKDRVKEILFDLYRLGQRRFYIYSEADLTILIEKAFYEAKFQDGAIFILKALPAYHLDGIILVGKENVPHDEYNSDNRVDLILEVSKENSFVSL